MNYLKKQEFNVILDITQQAKFTNTGFDHKITIDQLLCDLAELVSTRVQENVHLSDEQRSLAVHHCNCIVYRTTGALKDWEYDCCDRIGDVLSVCQLADRVRDVLYDSDGQIRQKIEGKLSDKESKNLTTLLVELLNSVSFFFVKYDNEWNGMISTTNQKRKEFAEFFGYASLISE